MKLSTFSIVNFSSNYTSKPTYIYGIGSGGKLLHQALSRFRTTNLIGFIDSNTTGVCLGQPVVTPDTIEDRADIQIIIGSQFADPIKKNLQHLEHVEVIDASKWLLSNEKHKYELDVAGLPNILFRDPNLHADTFFSQAEPEHRFGHLQGNAVEALKTALRSMQERRVLKAADALYSWLRIADHGTASGGWKVIPSKDTAMHSIEIDWESHIPEEDRFNCLQELKADFPGSYLLNEVCTLALSRYHGHHGRFREGLDILEAQKKNRYADPSQKHVLDNSIQAFHFALAGKPVPARLERLIGDDTHYLHNKTCLQPFKRFDIQPDGNVNLCCAHWLKKSVGNVLNNSHKNVLNSKEAIEIRNSVLDGSFEHCDMASCGLEVLPDIKTEQDVFVRKALDHHTLEVEHPVSVLFGFDSSCNLSCPSCRTELTIEKGPLRDAKIEAVENIILPIIRGAHEILINPAGEVFASKPSRALLSQLDRGSCPDLTINIISNGTLFTEEEWDRYQNIHDMIGYVRISTDAYHADTFQKLRRGGSHSIFVKNMEFLSRLRQEGKIPKFGTSFTYQLDNFEEMVEFAEWCERLHCDFVQFEKLENIAFSHDEYTKKAVHKPDHPRYSEFKRQYQELAKYTHCNLDVRVSELY